jgi:hypothetical protein
MIKRVLCKKCLTIAQSEQGHLGFCSCREIGTDGEEVFLTCAPSFCLVDEYGNEISFEQINDKLGTRKQRRIEGIKKIINLLYSQAKQNRYCVVLTNEEACSMMTGLKELLELEEGDEP